MKPSRIRAAVIRMELFPDLNHPCIKVTQKLPFGKPLSFSFALLAGI